MAVYLFPLEFDEEIGTFPLKAPPEAKDVVDGVDKQYRWEKIARQDVYILKKRHLITGLVDSELTSQEREKIAKDLGLNDYFKYDYPVIVVLLKKSNWPIYGYFRFRSFRQVLEFLAESLKDQCEYERESVVHPSRFTDSLLAEANLKPGCLENPELTLAISSGKKVPEDSVVDVKHNGELFWVSSPRDRTDAHSQPTGWENLHPLRWDKQVFDMLYEIFQMNRVEPPVSPVLTSISK